ncbi:MAG: sigma-54-dependent Fis family transcriptional regulator, partial [Bdellovibrionales bacterium]|nr:sigma-54-dependent Fis family transcriptional regulator [Bdellovibrionales bacterium]
DLLSTSPNRENYLPALWEDWWIPSMCDPHSREVWIRWLPRYANYLNENPLIVGPTGSGKTRLAAALHHLSGRKGPFVSITPRDFSSTELVQAELFGAVAGAYTGAVEKWGLVKRADRGTLFIDELQSIDFDLQGKLITFIENKTYRRVGEAESHEADVRFVFATNRTLQELIREGRLRDDFAYRLERLQLDLPPLCERRLDIAAGICFALAKVIRERFQETNVDHHTIWNNPQRVEGLTAPAYRKLFAAQWPGNLRQLENTMAKLLEYASIDGRHLIDEEDADRALKGMLGHAELTSSEVFHLAARQVADQALRSGFTGIQECSWQLKEFARIIALERAGGVVEEASSIINDSTKVLEIFTASREFYE